MISPNQMPHTILIVLAGMPGAGKSAMSQLLAANSKNVHWIRSRDIIERLTRGVTSKDIYDRGLLYTTETTADEFFECLKDDIQDGKVNVFDSVRPVAHWDAIQRNFPGLSILISVTGSEKLRLERLTARDGAILATRRNRHEVEQDVPFLMKMSDFSICSDCTLNEMVTQLVAKMRHHIESRPDFSAFKVAISKVEDDLIKKVD